MPSSEYGNAVGGGLKLKGAKEAGVKKHKKKRAKVDSAESKHVDDAEKERNAEVSVVQSALANEEENEFDESARQKDVEMKEHGKTEAQRRHEERRKKRVGAPVNGFLVCQIGTDCVLVTSSTNDSNAKALKHTRSESRS